MDVETLTEFAVSVGFLKNCLIIMVIDYSLYWSIWGLWFCDLACLCQDIGEFPWAGQVCVVVSRVMALMSLQVMLYLSSDSNMVRYHAVSSFIFLRFFAPAILGPKLFDLRSDTQVSSGWLILDSTGPVSCEGQRKSKHGSSSYISKFVSRVKAWFGGVHFPHPVWRKLGKYPVEGAGGQDSGNGQSM